MTFGVSGVSRRAHLRHFPVKLGNVRARLPLASAEGCLPQACGSRRVVMGLR